MTVTEVKPTVVLGPELAGTLMTPEEFDAIEEADENHVYELIHGVLIVSPPVLETERGPNEFLGYLLLKYRHEHPQGSALDWTLPENYVKTPTSRRRADRVIWAGLGRIPDARRDVATIAAEFLSKGKRSRRRDYQDKREEYHAAGIEEYWLFDRFRRVMIVFRRPPARPAEIVVAANEVYRTQLLPGFEVPVAQILAVADMLEKAGAAKKPVAKNTKKKRSKH